MTNKIKKRGEIIPLDVRQVISRRYHAITKSINQEFWQSSSDSCHSLYVGSYGRNTAIDTSDIDILVELPSYLFDYYNQLNGNSQSKLLQAVKSAILITYPNSDVHADGQVIKILFSDDIYFEIVPAFMTDKGTYKYPDSNHGGRWRSTNPKTEQDAMFLRNQCSNGLLFDTCKHIRYIRDNYFKSYTLSGIVIDSFIYEAIGNWRWLNPGEPTTRSIYTYEQHLWNYFCHHDIHRGIDISAPGSNEIVATDSSYECLEKVLKSMV